MTETPIDWTYVRENPGRIWRHGKDLVVTVPLPEMNEPKEVTRARLREGVGLAFVGDDTDLLETYQDCVEAQDLLVMEVDLTRREYGVVLHP